LTLHLEAKKCLLNESKFQQQEDVKMKQSSAFSKSTNTPNDKETSDSNMPSQYERVTKIAKEEEVIKNNMVRPMFLMMNFLKNQ
jgi:hypothetical protein